MQKDENFALGLASVPSELRYRIRTPPHPLCLIDLRSTHRGETDKEQQSKPMGIC